MGPTAFVDKNGKIVSVEGGSVTLKISSDVYIMGSFRDITENKKTEEMRRSMIERSPDGIVTVDTRGVITSCNTASTKMLGFSKNELVGKHFVKSGVLKMRQFPEFLKIFRRVLKGKLVKPLELTFYRKDGKPLLCEVRLGLLKEGGKISGIQAISRDITKQKKAEKALRESQEKFKRFFMSNPEAADYLGPNFEVLDVNPRFETLFGYSREEVLSKEINDLLVPEDKREEAGMLDKNAEKGYVYYESIRRRKDGTLIPVSISAAPIVVNGKLIGTVGLYKDISQLKKTESALKSTLEKLEVTNEKLRVVGGFTRHDVLNKFSAILGNVYLAKKRLGESHESLVFMKEIESSCQEAKALFDFAETYEKLGLEELVYVNVEEVIERALSLFPDLHKFWIMAECRGLEVLADSLLQQLFYNLVHNTVEHGENVRQIRIWCEEGKHELKLVYQDDGIGIPSSDKLKIFKVDPRRSGGYGLHLIKKICEVYGWSIQETGKQGEGAQFTITIPRSHESGIEGYQLS
jgi:PAS domain S-box-containing protein